MILYTGYFSKTKKYVEAGLTPISISRFTPNFFKYARMSILAPPVDLLNKFKQKEITEDTFTIAYLDYLHSFPPIYLEQLQEEIEKDNLIFLCYEKPTDFCHRHILARFLKEKFNIEVKEFEA